MKCPECDGQGWVEGVSVEPECCGRLSPSGGCWGDCAVPVQVQTQEHCPQCGGHGALQLQESKDD